MADHAQFFTYVHGMELGLLCPLAGSYWHDDHGDYTIGTNGIRHTKDPDTGEMEWGVDPPKYELTTLRKSDFEEWELGNVYRLWFLGDCYVLPGRKYFAFADKEWIWEQMPPALRMQRYQWTVEIKARGPYKPSSTVDIYLRKPSSTG